MRRPPPRPTNSQQSTLVEPASGALFQLYRPWQHLSGRPWSFKQTAGERTGRQGCAGHGREDIRWPVADPGSITSATISSGRTPRSFSRAWRLWRGGAGGDRPLLRAAARARGRARSRQGLAGGMERARQPDREAGRRSLVQRPQDHRRRLLPARRHLPLQRRALHRARPGEEGARAARLQGLAPGHPAAPSERRVRRGAL